MASELDKLQKVGIGTATTLSAPGKAAAATSITVGSTANFPTTTGITFAIRVVDGNGELVAGTYTEWVGTVTSGTTLAMNAVPVYGSDQVYAAGSTTQVYMPLSSYSYNKMIDGLLAEHANPSGTHTNITQADANYIKDDAGNELLKWSKTASAVNEITIKNAATGTDPRISATGGDSAVNLNLLGKGLAKTVTIGAGATTIFPYDYVVSGCVWTADAAGSTRLASMTAGVVVINGNPITVAAVTSRTFTASKDVYVDVLDNGDGTGLLVYTDGTTNAASGALAANSIRLAIIVVGASSIATAASINQGEETRVLPIASSIPYAVTDSLGNLICPRDPNRKLLGYKQIISTFTSATTSATDVDVTGLSIPVIVPTGRKVKITIFAGTFYTTAAAGQNLQLKLKEGATVINFLSLNQPVASYGLTGSVEAITTPSAGLHTYKVTILQNSGAGTMNFGGGSATQPAFIKVELV